MWIVVHIGNLLMCRGACFSGVTMSKDWGLPRIPRRGRHRSF